jgi:hypothetical protein
MRYVGKERHVEPTPDELNAWLGKETGKPKTVVRFGQSDALDEAKIKQQLTGALRKLLLDDSSPKTSTERAGSRGQRRLSKKPSRRKRKI